MVYNAFEKGEQEMSQKLNILVVDDQKVIGDLFEFTLGYSGHAITVVDNAANAIDRLKDQSFDIAFLDIVMPQVDGVETFKRIKEVNPNLPIVMMSGYSVEERRTLAKDLGAIACLKKPFEMDDVKKIIQVALGKEI